MTSTQGDSEVQSWCPSKAVLISLLGGLSLIVALFFNMSFYRKTVWVVKGLREYTKSGYASASKHFNASDLEVDLAGRSFMITGANSGIGKVTATEIARRGGEVHMVCRSRELGEAAQQEILQTTGRTDGVHLHLLDMSQPRDVAKFADEFSSSGKQLNVLVNNAGCMINTRELVEDTLEKNFATNTLGTHILTEGLIPALSKADDPRVIIVTSGGMLTVKLDVKDMQFEQMKPFDGTMAYAQNKRQQVVMTEQYALKHPTIHFSTMHPGWADTPAVQSSMPDFYEKMKNRLRSAEEGADTLVWLSVSAAAKQHASGLFFQDRKEVSTHLRFGCSKPSAEDETKLMSLLEQMRKKYSF